MSPAPTPGRAARTLLLVLATALPLLSASPASAHDRLERVDPPAGSRLRQQPERVQLVFDQAVEQRFATVAVTGPDGSARAAGAAQVLDGTVTQTLATAGPAGVYTLAYRVVSADGHPVTGTSTFTVAGPAGSAAPGRTGPQAAAARAPAAERSRPRSRALTEPTAVGLLAGGLLAAVLVVGVLVTRHRRQAAATAAPGDPS